MLLYRENVRFSLFSSVISVRIADLCAASWFFSNLNFPHKFQYHWFHLILPLSSSIALSLSNTLNFSLHIEWNHRSAGFFLNFFFMRVFMADLCLSLHDPPSMSENFTFLLVNERFPLLLHLYHIKFLKNGGLEYIAYPCLSDCKLGYSKPRQEIFGSPYLFAGMIKKHFRTLLLFKFFYFNSCYIPQS